MTTATQEFNIEAIDQWGEPVEFPVERQRIQAYAAATNDTIAPHAAGDIAPPVFAIVPAFQALSVASVSVIPSDFLLGILHGEQDFRYHAPIHPDTTLVTRAKPIGLRGRSSGVTVSLVAETRDRETDELLVEQYMVPFVRGASFDGEVGEQAPQHGLGDSIRLTDPAAEVEQTFDADQTFRYSEASGDPVPVHLDDEIARSVGLPGIIIHGLCTMAFTSRAIIELATPDDPTRLGRLAARFSRTVQPKQTIATRIWDNGGAYAFETTSDSGDIVITDGLAEIS